MGHVCINSVSAGQGAPGRIASSEIPETVVLGSPKASGHRGPPYTEEFTEHLRLGFSPGPGGDQVGFHTSKLDVLSKFDQEEPIWTVEDDIPCQILSGYPQIDICPSECGKAFIKKSWLPDHQNVHTGEKPHRCCLCGKAFSRKFMLTEHQRMHTGEKPYECTEYGKAFLKKTRLNVHQKTHTGEKHFLCGECGKGFIQKGNLIVHQRIHTGEKPYICSECGKGFIQKMCLIAHQRVHTGKTPFRCSQQEGGKGKEIPQIDVNPFFRRSAAAAAPGSRSQITEVGVVTYVIEPQRVQRSTS
ncbi:hypothetical protein PANDA_017432 [Ailuropoda melanoleuca]|uniref:C2H2-type domain-containing protein n=1 Tax=Ailuropoda melanoleuca TaxID=9646 RepID=D2HXP7_AILME|nr:hypothetical protein PANDA_017432 [Ailuropoda melanoleuca]